MKNKRKQRNQTGKDAGMKAEEAPSLRIQREAADDRLLLSLFSASSIQQGGAREPGVQPGQAGSLCEAGRGMEGVKDGGMGL